jgi:hypothetical protein
MRNAAGQDENVPRRMKISDPVQGKENNAERVGDPSGAEPHHPVRANRVHERPRCKNDQPSLEQIHRDRRCRKPLNGKAFEKDAGNRQRPHDCKQRPSYWPSERYQRKGGVGFRRSASKSPHDREHERRAAHASAPGSDRASSRDKQGRVCPRKSSNWLQSMLSHSCLPRSGKPLQQPPTPHPLHA